jgi:hypothetical protein
MSEKKLNTEISSPPEWVVKTFRKGIFERIQMAKGDLIYRIATKNDEKNKVIGNNFLEGTFWIDSETFKQLSSRLDYDSFLGSLTSIARNALALTTDFSKLADCLIGAELKVEAYAWRGKTASQTEYFKNGVKWIYPGNSYQLWLPNLNAKSATFKFFHSI